MSRVGLNPISIPDGVTVNVSGSNINIKGPKGELNQSFDSDFKIKIDETFPDYIQQNQDMLKSWIA